MQGLEDPHSEFIELSQGNGSSRTDIEVSLAGCLKKSIQRGNYDGDDDGMSLIVG